MNPTFSVIIPVHNREEQIRKAMTSVITQTYPDWELIVVDDGSTDNTIQSIKDMDAFNMEYTGDINKVRMVTQPNKERCFARNAGMKKARNDWIVWLDSDDYLDARYLECIAEAIRMSPEAQMVVCGYIKHWDNVTHVGRVHSPEQPVETGITGTGRFVFKRDLLETVGYLPEAENCYQLSDMAGIPGYNSSEKTLGNPWGDDFYLYRKLRDANVKEVYLDMLLYVINVRQST